jgi:hypothetical protein
MGRPLATVFGTRLSASLASLVSHRAAELIGALVRTVAFWPTRRGRSRFFGRLARRELRVLLRRPTSP